MKAEVIIIENERDLKMARALVAALGRSRKAADVARLRAQALLLEAYEKSRWPTPAVNVADLLRYAMEQHGLEPADLVPLLGSRVRVNEVLSGKRAPTLSMIRKLHDRLGIPAELLLTTEPSAAA